MKKDLEIATIRTLKKIQTIELPTFPVLPTFSYQITLMLQNFDFKKWVMEEHLYDFFDKHEVDTYLAQDLKEHCSVEAFETQTRILT